MLFFAKKHNLRLSIPIYFNFLKKLLTKQNMCAIIIGVKNQYGPVEISGTPCEPECQGTLENLIVVSFYRCDRLSAEGAKGSNSLNLSGKEDRAG